MPTVEVDQERLDRRAADAGTQPLWQARLMQTRALTSAATRGLTRAGAPGAAGRGADLPAGSREVVLAPGSRSAPLALRALARPTGSVCCGCTSGSTSERRVPRARAGQGVRRAGRGGHHLGHRGGQPAPGGARGLAQPAPADRGHAPTGPRRHDQHRRQPDHRAAAAVRPARPRRRATARRDGATRGAGVRGSAGCSPPPPASAAGCPGPVHLNVAFATRWCRPGGRSTPGRRGRRSTVARAPAPAGRRCRPDRRR